MANNWSEQFGYKMAYKGHWDAALGSFPSDPKIGNVWIASSSGTMVDVLPSPDVTLTVNIGDHFMYTETGFEIVSSGVGVGEIINWIVVDALSSPPSYEAVPGDYIIADTNYGLVTVILPTNANVDDRIVIVPARATYSVYPLVIDNNGELIGGVNDTLNVNVDGLVLEFIWQGGAIGWVATDGTGPIYNIDLTLIAPLSTWIYKNSDFYVFPDEKYIVDTSAGPVTATLPTLPSATFTAWFKDAKGTFDTNNLTLVRGPGATYSLINDGANPFVINKQYYTFEIAYDITSNNMTF